MAPGNPSRYAFRQQLTDPWILKLCILLGIGDKTKLQEGGGTLVVMQNVESCIFHPPAVGAVAGGDLAQNIGSERC